MARAVKVIDLAEPVEHYEVTVRQVGIRSPNGADAMVDPVVYVRTRDGATYPVENEAVLRDLMDRLIVRADGTTFDGGPPMLSAFSLEDGMAVKAAVLAFFTEAAQRMFEKRSTSSSSITRN